MTRKDEVLGLVTHIVGNAQTAEQVLDALQDGGWLNLGYGDADIERVLDSFKKTFGTTKSSKDDRFAANRLVKKYGVHAVVGIVQLLGQHSGAEYAPVVNNVRQVEDKWVSILSFVRKQQAGSEVIDNV